MHRPPTHLFRHLAIISSIVVILGITIVGKIFHNPDHSANTTLTDSRTPDPATSTGIRAESTQHDKQSTAKTDETVNGNKTEESKQTVAYNNENKLNTPAAGQNGTAPENENKQQPANTKNGSTLPEKAKKGKVRNTGRSIQTTHAIAQNEAKTMYNDDNNIYNSSNSNAGKTNPASKETREGNKENKTINTENTNGPATTNKPVAATNIIKKDSIKNTKKQPADETKNTPAHPLWSKRFEAGIKGGYEGGADNRAAAKYVISPYLQYNLSSKFSLMTQPAIKYAGLSSRSIGQSNSYYRVNEDGRITQNGATQVTTSLDGGTIDKFYTTKYTYTQSHDSIVKSYTTGGTYMEFEIPLLLKYAISHKFSVYGGINVVFSKLTGIKESTYTRSGITRSVDTTITTTVIASPPLVNNMITYSGTPFSGYKGPLYTNPQENKIAAGYMIGLSYKCSKRWLFDALVLQSPYKPYIIGGYNFNAPVSLPYFRLTAGYCITK